MNKHGILSFKGTVKEFRAFLQGLKAGLEVKQSPSLQSSITIRKSA